MNYFSMRCVIANSVSNVPPHIYDYFGKVTRFTNNRSMHKHLDSQLNILTDHII